MAVSLQEQVYFGTFWQIADTNAPGVAIATGNGFTNQRVERAADGSFYAGVVEKVGTDGGVTDVVVAFAGAAGMDAVPSLAWGYGGVEMAEAVRAAALFASLLADPRYAGATIHVTGHSMGAGLTQYVAAWALANLDAAMIARADFTGFGSPSWGGMSEQHFGLERRALDAVYTSYTAANDITRTNGIAPSGVDYVLPTYDGNPGLTGPATNLLGAHQPAYYGAVLGLPDWLAPETAAAMMTQASLTSGISVFNTGWGNPGQMAIRVEGGVADDSLIGLGGNDVLIGGAGADRLAGGAGADRFTYTALGDSGITAATADRIVDFSRAQGDRIDLSAIDARAGILGNQAFHYVAGGSFTGAGQVTSWIDGNTTWIALNTDSDAAPEMLIALDGAHVLNANDFIL